MPVHNFLGCLIDNSPQTQDIRNMKSLLLSVSFFTATLAIAQTESPFKPKAGHWSTEATCFLQTGNNAVRFGLNDIKIRRFNTDQSAHRLRLLATQNKETTIIVGNQGNMERNINEGAVFLAPGFEKHLDGTQRFSPYWGTELLVGKAFYEYNLSNSTNGQTFSDGGNFNTTTKKAYSLGLNFIVGADFYIGKQIFLGAEVGYGFIYQSFGESLVEIKNNGNVVDSKTVPMGKNQGLKLIANPGIRVGFAF